MTRSLLHRLFALALMAALGLAAGAGPALADPVTIRVGYIPVIGAAQLFVIDQQGWAREAQIDLQLTQFDSGPNAIQGLASGTIDAYWAGVGPLAVARARGVDVRVVAATAIEELAMVTSGALAEQLGEGGTPAEAFARFAAAQGRPARLATQPAGSVPNTVLQYWLWEVARVERSQVEIVPMGIDATQQALLAGAVDGATIREPALTIVQDRDPHARLVALGGQMFPNQPGTVLAVTGALVQQHPEAVRALVALTVRATELLHRDPAAGVPAVQSALGRGLVEPDTLRRALASPASRFIADPRAIIESTAAMQDFQVRIGVLERAAPLDGLFDTSFYDAAARP